MTSTKVDTITIGSELEVHRLGFGAMRLTGEGIWGSPEDPDECRATLRRALELGVDFIDTADSYGPGASEDLIREALHPYPRGLRIATKAGLTRTGPMEWLPVGRPEYLRQQCMMSLRRLGVETIDLFQLHRIDEKVPREEQFGLLKELKDEGKVREVGLSQVTVEEIEAAREVVAIASVQNRYNLADQSDADVLEYCQREGIAFIPWAPIDAGKLVGPDSPVGRAAEHHGVSAGPVALAWLLHRSPVIVPIPGTSKVAHLEENMRAADLELSAEEISEIGQAVAA
ncbi:MAG: aldo/keto reductase [Solirubrobacteraceae bacterium]